MKKCLFFLLFGLCSIGTVFGNPPVGSAGPLAWEILDNVLSIRGDGQIPDYHRTDNPMPWHDYKDQISGIKIYEGVTGIGNDAFYECREVISVSIPGTVTAIGENAFHSCEKLISVVIPESVTDIGAFAFAVCSDMTSVMIPASVTYIGNAAFGGCTGLTEVVNIGKTPITIPDDVFLGVNYNSCRLQVPLGSVEAYVNTACWKKNFSTIGAINLVVTLDPSSFWMIEGTERTVVGAKNPPTSSATIYWNSVYPDVATVDATGKVTAVSPGWAVIVAGNSQDKRQYSCTFKVLEKGTSSVEGTINHTGTEEVTVNLYINTDTDTKQGMSQKKLVGTHVLLNTVKLASGSNQYSFNNLPAGSYVVEVVINGYESEPADEITLTEGETGSGINFTIENGIIIPINIFTGVELPVDAGLKIYPNPFTGILRIESPENGTLRIFSVDGKQVHVQTVAGDEIIQLEHLPAGMYFIRLENGGRSKTVKVIKH